MTIVEQLSALLQRFPDAKELAVTPEMRNEFEAHIVQAERYLKGYRHGQPPPPIESLPNGVIAQRTTLFFKTATLTVVHKEMRRASSGFPVSYVRQARTGPPASRQAHKSPHLR